MKLPRIPHALVLIAALLVPACGRQTPTSARDFDVIAERYVKLVLAVGRHDPDYVDSYYGPPEWKEEAQRDSVPLDTLRARAEALDGEIHAVRVAEGDTLAGMRQSYLHRMGEALVGRIRMLQDEKFSFDEESQMLYDAVAPRRDDASFEPALATLDSLLPGKGPLHERYDEFRKALIIPPAKVDAVFRAAVEESRRRTREHIALPDSETFLLEYVKNQPWSGYNWYQGGLKSLIQVNVDLPIYIDRAVDLAAHEGYPGHHLYNALLEQALVRNRGWLEFTVYPLHTPMSLIAEGSANVAPEVVFPGEEKLKFEREVLFPLAGLDPAIAERYGHIRAAADQLEGVSIEAARRYLEGEFTREQFIEWSMRHVPQSRGRAERALRFAERYRSYVINYGLGKRIVLDWLAANGGDAAHPERRWELFKELLASPRLPADLRPAAEGRPAP